MGQIRRRKRRIDLDVTIEIERLARDNRGVRQIESHLIKEFPRDKVPHPKTIQRIIVDETTPRDTSAAWRLAGADPEDAALILPVLFTASGHWLLTITEAEWVVRIRSAAPDLPIDGVRDAVKTYVSAQRHERDTGLLDLVLSRHPWRSEGDRDATDRYLRQPVIHNEEDAFRAMVLARDLAWIALELPKTQKKTGKKTAKKGSKQ